MQEQNVNHVQRIVQNVTIKMEHVRDGKLDMDWIQTITNVINAEKVTIPMEAQRVNHVEQEPIKMIWERRHVNHVTIFVKHAINRQENVNHVSLDMNTMQHWHQQHHNHVLYVMMEHIQQEEQRKHVKHAKVIVEENVRRL